MKSTHQPQVSVLFLCKRVSTDPLDRSVKEAIEFMQKKFPCLTLLEGDWGEPLPKEAREWRGDYIVSFLSRWVVPETVLGRARLGAINFHPAPPEYPGIGCTNFALYDGVDFYGVTCHEMRSQVDTGKIIAVKRFPILQEDSVRSLLERTYQNMNQVFLEIMNLISAGDPLPETRETWTRPPFTRSEFSKLSKITPDMSPSEVSRRVRATTFGKWKPTVEIAGFTFELKVDPEL